ncbi:hypothetical protein NDU88_005189 [Pleurodeles waltl]|uniref:Uncharacterized protein n=1 Tax=Pleurodeles waltl TaxID=8319 RepID=A0AAV7WAR4_PLEWA|nr:hypothetical protein NDU88_005189 [Pleurodeles waltl]
MAPKSLRSGTDKTESVRKARLAKEGGDGHSTGKWALGGSTKIGCKINAGAVRDGKDQLRDVQPDNKLKDKLQSKTQPSITDFLAYEDLGPIPKDPPMLMEASGGTSNVELGLCMDMKPGENSLNSKNPQDCGEGLIEGCPESCVKKRMAQEKTEAVIGADADRNQLSETEKAEYDRRNGEWLKEGGD